MKERPILMTTENAQKCYDGTKTQTRRLVKYNPACGDPEEWCKRIHEPGFAWIIGDYRRFCPFGQVGSWLWVRERGWQRPHRTPQMLRDGADTWEPYYYDALLIPGEAEELKGWGFQRRPSIYMPREMCRTVLEITGIRVERLQDISEDDAQAEGSYLDRCACMPRSKDKAPLECAFNQTWCRYHGEEFKSLWESINGKGSWGLNPWVWCLTFKKVNHETTRSI